MFSELKKTQKEFYNEIVQAVVVHHRLSHSYLIETKNLTDVSSFAYSVAKFFLCSEHYIEIGENCADCNLCHLIDTGVSNHIVSIKPDGQWIKKEQLLNLKSEFNNKSFDNHSRIYIIFDADKLNKSAANSILKFLEEPESGIIALLLTKNKYQVLNTIRSRCQTYSLSEVSSDEVCNVPSEIVDLAMDMERLEKKMIAYLSQLWHTKYKLKDDYLRIFLELKMFYRYLLELKILSKDPEEEYVYILRKNEIFNLIHKIEVLEKYQQRLEYNVNLNLFLDQFLIDFFGGVKI